MTETTTAERRPRIAVIGGTGALGSGLAGRWARAGYSVVIGSRDSAKARAAAAAIAVPAGLRPVEGLAQADAAASAEVIVLAVPFAAHGATLEAIRPHCAGRIVVDASVPLMPPKVGTAQIPAEGCAAVQTGRRLGEMATVVSAFHNVSAAKLNDTRPIDCDVLVFGDVRAARETVIRLVEAAGLRGLHGGPLANSIAAEAMTSVLITINRLYKVDGAGIRITGPGNDGGLA
ncbi:MAG: NADPH-dependent F420 reductase [Acetobacteraceae bacterium]